MTRLSAEDRRTQILSAARDEFLEVGPEGARISRIAERAGVNQALLYRYFPSKDAMFEAAVIEPLNEALGRLLEQVADTLDSQDPAGATHVFYRNILQIFDDTFELLSTVLFSDRHSGHEFYESRIAPFLDGVDEQVRRAERTWPNFDAPTSIVPISLGMCWGVVMDAHFRGITLDLDDVADHLTAVTTGGVLARRSGQDRRAAGRAYPRGHRGTDDAEGQTPR